MGVTYEWDCTSVDVIPAKNENNDVIYKVHWSVTGLSDALDPEGNPYEATLRGKQLLDTEGIEEFTPIGEVTHALVTEWVKAALELEHKGGVEDSVLRMIEKKITPEFTSVVID